MFVLFNTLNVAIDSHREKSDILVYANNTDADQLGYRMMNAGFFFLYIMFTHLSNFGLPPRT